ncbi:hypothetical protein SDC9_35313 [bioreactor metagenome]|uniref:Prenylated flavin chaperone LpdD-like domain-containing protein n=1 Tax=bioreactor metagenome TaxID=1076179 RepID=A0A644VD38_9ZZZZ|nr:hypothetical protein [Acidaminococcaceae bacterium]
MNTKQLEIGSNPYKISATVTLCGTDVAVIIGGGEKPHVGAVGLASPRPSLKDASMISASVSVICVLGHKDDMLAREAALFLSSKFNINVVVSVGLHLDNATKEDIEKLKDNFDAIIIEVEEWLQLQKF